MSGVVAAVAPDAPCADVAKHRATLQALSADDRKGTPPQISTRHPNSFLLTATQRFALAFARRVSSDDGEHPHVQVGPFERFARRARTPRGRFD